MYVREVLKVCIRAALYCGAAVDLCAPHEVVPATPMQIQVAFDHFYVSQLSKLYSWQIGSFDMHILLLFSLWKNYDMKFG